MPRRRLFAMAVLPLLAVLLTAQAFIGRTRDAVLKAFGPANSVSSDNYRYWPKSGVYKVEFQCYDFRGYVCGQMLVQF